MNPTICGNYDDEYFKEKYAIERQLQSVSPIEDFKATLQRFAAYLREVPAAWAEATDEQRNRLLRHPLEEVWFKDDRVIVLRPRPEAEPFSKLSFDEWLGQLNEFEEEAPTRS